MSLSITQTIEGEVVKETRTMEQLMEQLRNENEYRRVTKSEKETEEEVEKRQYSNDYLECINRTKKVWTKDELIREVEKFEPISETRNYFISTFKHFCKPGYEMCLLYHELKNKGEMDDDDSNFEFYIFKRDGRILYGVTYTKYTVAMCDIKDESKFKNMYNKSASEVSNFFKRYFE